MSSSLNKSHLKLTTMANSKNTKRDRDEKKSGDLSELHNNYSFDAENDLESASPEFTSKYSSSKGKDEKENDNSTSAYASKINKSFGNDSHFKNKDGKAETNEDSYTSQLGTDQRSSSKESFKSTSPNQYSGRTHQLSYDQQFRHQEPQFQQPYDANFNQNQQFQNQRYQQGFSNPYGNQGSFNQHQPFGFNQQQPYQNQNPYNQGSFQNQDFRQHSHNQRFGYQQPYGQQYANPNFQSQGF